MSFTQLCWLPWSAVLLAIVLCLLSRPAVAQHSTRLFEGTWQWNTHDLVTRQRGRVVAYACRADSALWEEDCPVRARWLASTASDCSLLAEYAKERCEGPAVAVRSDRALTCGTFRCSSHRGLGISFALYRSASGSLVELMIHERAPQAHRISRSLRTASPWTPSRRLFQPAPGSQLSLPPGWREEEVSPVGAPHPLIAVQRVAPWTASPSRMIFGGGEPSLGGSDCLHERLGLATREWDACAETTRSPRRVLRTAYRLCEPTVGCHDDIGVTLEANGASSMQELQSVLASLRPDGAATLQPMPLGPHESPGATKWRLLWALFLGVLALLGVICAGAWARRSLELGRPP